MTTTVTAPPRTVTAPPVTATATVTTTVTPSTAQPPTGYTIGQSYTSPTGATVTVVAYQDRGVGQAEAGSHYVDLEVQVCVGDSAGSVSAGVWSLIGNDNGHYGDIVSGGGLHEPQYPFEQDEAAGACVRGWISIQVPTGTVITGAYYNPVTQAGDEPVLATWKLA